MAKAPKRAGAVVLGLGWYRPEDRDRQLQVIADRDTMHGSYAAWLASAQQGERDLLAHGQPVERVIVDPDELASWCLIRGRAPDSAARAKFVSGKMRLAAQQRRQ